jgi:hypothetical protein
MADRFYSVVAGEHLPNQVTEGASTSSEAIELRVSDAVYTNRLAVIHGVKAILRYLQATEKTPIS